jgi:UDP-N-acetylmuramoylalanine--D-glutamate ligase
MSAPLHVVVVGLAETGAAVTRRLRVEGHEVTVVEDAPHASARYGARAAEARAHGATVVEVPAAAEAAALGRAADLVVPSPLVRPGHPVITAAVAAGAPVRSEIDVAAERATAPIVAVTGTNGKTTVTSMIVAMLEASGRRAIPAGNIGRPLIDAIGDDVDVIVAEVSSFQLEFAETFRPRVAVLLAITPDHLDWHGSFERYVAAKARITEHQEPSDLIVFDADDARASEVASASRARRVGVSGRADAPGCFRVVADVLVCPDGSEIVPLAGMRRALLHDRTNGLAAAAAAFEAGASTAGVRGALGSYATMPHRVALVGEANWVRWYDDSKATNPDATLRALGSFESVVLLAGGRNKGLDLGVLAREAGRLRGLVAFGEARDELVAAFRSLPGDRVVTAASMHDAVRAAREFAKPGDVVLLSPACASFDMYEHYGARGDDFAAEVRAQALGEGARR